MGSGRIVNSSSAHESRRQQLGIVARVRAMSEYERKLDAPAGFQLPPLGGRPLERRMLTSVYYDVPEASLATAGITLRHRTENGHGVWQLKLPADDHRLELEAKGEPERPPEELLGLLLVHLRRGPLERVAELRTHRSGELVARNGTTAEVTADEVTVMDSQEARDRFVEIEIELRDGSPAGLDEIANELFSAGAKPGNGLPKLFRVLGRTGAPGPTSRSFEELRRRLGEQLLEIECHDPGTRLGRDPESLHEMRVAVRRFRALLRAGAELIATDTADLDARLKQLGEILGEVRDLDVLLERLEVEAGELGEEDAKHARSLLASLRTERSCSRARLLAALGSNEYLSLLDDAGRTIEELEPSGSSASLGELADKASAKVRKAVRKLPNLPADEDLHAVRKQGKRARYAAELAGRKTVVRRAKKFQDVLGEHQDAVVAAERLRELAARGLPEQTLAVGRLVEREERRRLEARKAWPKAWKRLRKAG
jgi:CHAD domain-containing protein